MMAGKNIWPRFLKFLYFEHMPTRRYSGLSVRFIVGRPGFNSPRRIISKASKND